MYGLNPGTKIAQYSLEEPLGQGGQGSVWRARANGQGEPVALKVIPVRGTPATMVERVRREAEALMSLSQGNPSVVTCLGIHEDQTLGVLAVAMEMVDGVELGVALRDRRCDGPAREQILLHIARALGHLHAAGVIHRDIKPANILVKHRFFDDPRDPSTVKLVDFGIATPKGNPKPLTEVGTVIGTPAYMPPERIDPLFWKPARGLPAEDVFAFGVVAYEALFGQHPAHVEDDGTLSIYAERYRAISRNHEPWPSLPPSHHLVPALSGALALDVERRLPDGNAVVQAMQSGARTVDDPSLRASQAPRTELAMPVMGMPDGGGGAFAPPGQTQLPGGAGIAPPGQTQVASMMAAPDAQASSWTPSPPQQQGWAPAVQPVPNLAPPAQPQRQGKSGLSPLVLVLGVFGLLAVGVPTAVLASRFVGGSSDDDHPPISVPTDTAAPTVTSTAADTSTATATDTIPPPIPTPTFTATTPVATSYPTTKPTATSTYPTYPTTTATTTAAPTTTVAPTTTSTGNGRPPIIGGQPTTTATTPPPATNTSPVKIGPIVIGRPTGGTPTTAPPGNNGGRPGGGANPPGGAGGNNGGRPGGIIIKRP